MEWASLINGGISLLGGLLGRKRKDPTPAQNIMSQAQGARQAADAYGFNPLTMLQYGQPGGAMGGGGGAPLASIELITGGLKDVADAFTGEAARRRAADQLEMDLAQLKLDQLRSGVLAVAPSAASAIGSGPTPIGPRTATVVQSAGRFQPARGGFNERSRKTGPFGPDNSPDPHRDSVPNPEPLLDRGSGHYVNGVYVEPAPGSSPASVMEENYGEMHGEIRGWQNYFMELLPGTRRIMDRSGWTQPDYDYSGELLSRIPSLGLSTSPPSRLTFGGTRPPPRRPDNIRTRGASGRW